MLTPPELVFPLPCRLIPLRVIQMACTVYRAPYIERGLFATVVAVRASILGMLHTSPPDQTQTVIPRRYLKAAILTLFVFGILATISIFSGVSWNDRRNWPPFVRPHNPKPPTGYAGWHEIDDPLPPSSLADFPNCPPNYTKWHEIENALPQHDENLKFPEGKEGRYVYFSGHMKGASILLAAKRPGA